MRTHVRLMMVLGGGLLLVMSIALAAHRSLAHVPRFYRDALDVDAADERRASDELLENVAALVSKAREHGRWHALFACEQINGWLAVDRVKNHPDLLPAEFSDPRVSIEADRMQIACRYDAGPVSTVVSLDFDVYLSAPNQVMLRIRRARAGALPLPLNKILDGIGQAARDWDLRIEWYRAQGDPVACITFPPPRTEHGTLLTIETLELHQGELYVAGTTLRDSTKSSEPSTDDASREVAAQSGDQENRQR